MCSAGPDVSSASLFIVTRSIPDWPCARRFHMRALWRGLHSSTTSMAPSQSRHLWESSSMAAWPSSGPAAYTTRAARSSVRVASSTMRVFPDPGAPDMTAWAGAAPPAPAPPRRQARIRPMASSSAQPRRNACPMSAWPDHSRWPFVPAWPAPRRPSAIEGKRLATPPIMPRVHTSTLAPPRPQGPAARASSSLADTADPSAPSSPNMRAASVPPSSMHLLTHGAASPPRGNRISSNGPSAARLPARNRYAVVPSATRPCALRRGEPTAM